MAYVIDLTQEVEIFFAVWVGVYYIFAPIRVKFKHWHEAEPERRVLEIPQLPPDVAPFFQTMAPALARMGFCSQGLCYSRSNSRGQESFASIWNHPDNCDSISLISVRTPSAAVPKITSVMAFRTRFTDNSSIVTHTSRSSVFPEDPSVAAVRLAGFGDPELLYQLHRAWVQRDRGERIATLQNQQSSFDYYNWEHVRTFERLVKIGYFRLNRDQRRYVPTFKGAFLMCVRLLFPLKQILRRKRVRRAERLLRELGFGGRAAFYRLQQHRRNVEVVSEPAAVR